MLAVSEISNEIVVLDDGSTDNTLKICKDFDKVVDIHSQNGLPFDETRDRNLLLQMALKRKPDFVLALDGDEIIQPGAKNILLEEVNVLYPEASLFEIQALTIWDKPNQYRYDGIYSSLWASKLLRMSKQPSDLVFLGNANPGNIHCLPLPHNSLGWDKPIRSRIKIFHYGTYDEELRQKKFNFYSNFDPNNKHYDYLEIISDKGKLSGKKGMEFRSIPEGNFYDDVK